MAFEAVMLLAVMRDSETARRAALRSAHDAVCRVMSSTSGFVNIQLQDVEIDCLMNMPWEVESASVRNRLVVSKAVQAVRHRL